MSIPKTEQRNPESMGLYQMNTLEMTRLVIRANEDAVRAALDTSESIARAIDAVAMAFENGSHLIYVGAGTSGRLGILDAAECPPTFGVPYDTVRGVIAGGNDRVFRAGENEEDNYDEGVAAMNREGVSQGDVVVGISAAGGAKFVLGAMARAKELGATTVGICSNPDTALLRAVDIPIFTDTGAEVLTGSTRLKAGTAQKIVLNTITTCAMAKTGKIYENMMINLAPTNEKLRLRVIRIVREILSCDEEEAIRRLNENDWCIRDAVSRT